jgi:hypothetical protein
MTLKGLRLQYNTSFEGAEKNYENQTQAISHYLHGHSIRARGGVESQNL